MIIHERKAKDGKTLQVTLETRTNTDGTHTVLARVIHGGKVLPSAPMVKINEEDRKRGNVPAIYTHAIGACTLPLEPAQQILDAQGAADRNNLAIKIAQNEAARVANQAAFEQADLSILVVSLEGGLRYDLIHTGLATGYGRSFAPAAIAAVLGDIKGERYAITHSEYQALCAWVTPLEPVAPIQVSVIVAPAPISPALERAVSLYGTADEAWRQEDEEAWSLLNSAGF